MVGLDTGFFVRVLEGSTDAVQVWRKIVDGEESSVSCLSILELRKLSLKGALGSEEADILIDAILSICRVVWIDEKEILLAGANLSHSLGIPAIDALILAGFLMSDATTVYTTDSHLQGAKKKGVKIIKL